MCGQVIEVIFDVYILGHSCGISDRSILNEIFTNVSCRLIRLFHFRKDNPKEEFHEKSIDIMKYYEGKQGTSPKLKFHKEDVLVQLK